MHQFRILLLSIGIGFASILFHTAARAEDAKPWTERLKFNADFRYRHESIFREETKDRNRHRMRLRVGMKAEINDKTDLVFRLASGRGEPNSTNQDLGSASEQKPVWIDRAYMEYRLCKKWTVLGGKQPIPFVASDLVWDPDLNFEGISAKYGFKESKFYGSVGGYWLSESSGTRDQGLFSTQLGRIFSGEIGKLDLSIAYHDFQNTINGRLIGNSSGNTIDTSVYVTDFNLVQVRLDLERNMSTKQVNIWGEFVRNTSASAPLESASGDNPSRMNGYIVGVSLKSAKPRLPWDASYNVRVLERDAALAAFTDSDFIGGGTNGWGHRFSFAIVPETNLTLRSTYFLNYIDPYDNGSNLTYQRLMLDAEVKF